MKQNLFVKFRCKVIPYSQRQWEISKNGIYYPSFDFLDTRKWYVDNAWLKFYDQMLEGKYKTTHTTGTKLAVIEFDDTVVTQEDMAWDLEKNIDRTYSTVVLTKEQAKDFLNNNTDCTKVDNLDWTFTYCVREEETNEFSTTPAYFVTL